MGKHMVVRQEAHVGISATASAAITGGQAVKVTGAKTVGPTAANTDIAVGVAHKDAANGDTVAFRSKGDIIPMTAAAAIAAGAAVEVAAAGKVQTQSTGELFGVAWTAAAADGDEILIIVL